MKIAEYNWIPVQISLPDTSRIVIIQLKGYPDPTTGYFEGGKWNIANKFITDAEAPIIAWTEMPESYDATPEDLMFRTADETRLLTKMAITRRSQPDYDAQFYEIRELILHNLSMGQWAIGIPNLTERNRSRLLDAGFKIEDHKIDNVKSLVSIVSWK